MSSRRKRKVGPEKPSLFEARWEYPSPVDSGVLVWEVPGRVEHMVGTVGPNEGEASHYIVTVVDGVAGWIVCRDCAGTGVFEIAEGDETRCNVCKGSGKEWVSS